LRTPTSSCTIRRSLLASFPAPEKERERKKRRKEKERKRLDYWDLGSVSSPSFSSHGATGLGPFQGYAVSPTKPHESRVYDGNRACGLSHARGPHVPCTCRRICGDLCSILRAGIQSAIAPVPPLVVTALGPRATQSDPLGGPTHRDLHDFERGLYED
jgi:hypothetical protein